MTEKNNESKNMAIAGVCGAVIYGIADMFLYMGTDIFQRTLQRFGGFRSGD